MKSAIAANAGTAAGASRRDPVSHRVIVLTIIVTMPEQSSPSREELVGFYDEAYSHRGPEAQLYARWRALGARGKADHVIDLCSRGGVEPASTLEVGCGDGALLAELARR